MRTAPRLGVAVEPLSEEILSSRRRHVVIFSTRRVDVKMRQNLTIVISKLLKAVQSDEKTPRSGNVERLRFRASAASTVGDGDTEGCRPE